MSGSAAGTLETSLENCSTEGCTVTTFPGGLACEARWLWLIAVHFWAIRKVPSLPTSVFLSFLAPSSVNLFIFVCVYVLGIYVNHVHAGAPRSQKRTSDSLELELTGYLSRLMWVDLNL